MSGKIRVDRVREAANFDQKDARNAAKVHGVGIKMKLLLRSSNFEFDILCVNEMHMLIIGS